MLDASQIAAVRAQLERLLSSSSFKSSKRCQLLLTHLVEHSFNSDAEPLRERMLGVDVLGRKPQYDTASDPIVRVTAAEIRRRLGQYYGDPAHQSELRIDVPAGHYAATYSWPTSQTAIAATAEPDMAIDPVVPVAASGSFSAVAERMLPPLAVHATPGEPPDLLTARGRRVGLLVVSATIILGLLLVVVPRAFVASGRDATAAARFWEPLWQTTQPILVCTGAIDISHVSGRMWEAAHAPDQPEASADAAVPTPPQAKAAGTSFVTVTDALALARVVALFHEQAKPYRIRTDRATSFADLRASPTVLVGLFNNSWTMRLTTEFPYVPAQDETSGVFLIRERLQPSRGWHPDRPWPDPAVQRDYAFVSRVLDPATGNLVVIAAGVTPFGTVAAAELLTTPEHLERAVRSLPSDWPTKNVQFVLETRIVEGEAGPPRVVASRAW